MEYVNLGDSGLKVSRVALGSWLTFGSAVDASTTRACVQAALEGGVIFFDTADVYARGAAEELLGEALSDVKRTDIVLATKAFWPMSDNPNDRGLSRKHLVESVHASLGRLRTDYLDLFQCHRYDEDTPLHETVATMGMLIDQGKVLYWGVSCWTAAQILDACHIADELGCARPISNQPPYSLLERAVEPEVIPMSEREGLSQVVFSPLAQGVLTGKYSGGRLPAGSRGADEHRNVFMASLRDEQALKAVDQMVGLADEQGCSPAQLALAWCLRDQAVASVICGATRPEQVEENITASEVDLSDDVIERLDALFPPPEGPPEV
ncbi:MAG TPA: aldo/keto reductase [Deltaproteobacteria bacterium]|nr:aldo/keto reductase [Deltaproteobacteria bacterium]HCP44476.1 aldo/keto reductase [Deltaproteobacteria bacterium]